MFHTVKFHKIMDDAVLPIRATDKSAGYDVFNPHDIIKIVPNESLFVKLGFSLEIPQDYCNLYFTIHGRSSLTKRCIFTIPGIIDQDYKNEIGIHFKNSSNDIVEFHKGERIGQLVPHLQVENFKFEESNDPIKPTSRTGGFGSTNGLVK